MSAYKKHMKRKDELACQGLCEIDKKNYYFIKEAKENFEKILHKLHCDIFPEEYDFMYDDAMDISDRENALNPLKESYVKEINAKRQRYGLEEMPENGRVTTSSSYDFCRDVMLGKLGYPFSK